MVGGRGGARAGVRASTLFALLLVPATLSARDIQAPGLTAKWTTSDPPTGAWIDKKAPSTFFPDAMSDDEVIEAVLAAFQTGHRRGDGQFIGASGRGFAIEGWYQNGRISAAYPLRGP